MTALHYQLRKGVDWKTIVVESRGSYIILLQPNYGPGTLYINKQADSMYPALQFPSTTNELKFAKRWQDWQGKEGALIWAKRYIPKTHSYEIMFIPDQEI